MSDPIRLVREPAPDEGLIRNAEKVLADARAGRIVGMAVATQYADGSVGAGYTRGHGSNIWMLIGAVHELLSRLTKATEDL